LSNKELKIITHRKGIENLYGYNRLYGFLVLLIFILLFNVSIGQPVVVTQPQDTSVCVESSAGFSIIAVNTSSYQWQEYDGVGWYDLDGTFTYVTGQYTPGLTVIDANLALNGYLYRCIASDLLNDRDTSLPAQLGVYEPPFIINEPENNRVCKSYLAEFSINAINGTSFSWQEYNGVGWLDMEDNSFYQGTHTQNLQVYTVTGMDGILFRCIVKNVTCPDTSTYALLNVDPTPIVFSVDGGGQYCEGDVGLSVILSGSELGISYNLLKNSVETGLVLEGNGESLEFEQQTEEGVYSIIGYNQFTSCSTEMAESVSIVVNSLPSDYPVQGGGSICSGDPKPEVFLLSSETGVNYSLYHNAIYTGQTNSGTGYGLNFGQQENEGIYTIIAENIDNGCSQQMSGTAEIVFIQLPVANAGNDHNILQGENAQLTGSVSGGSGSYIYNWSPSNLCVTPNSVSTQTTSLYLSTIFTFDVADNQSGCASQPDTSIVYVGSGPLYVQAFSNSNNICKEESVDLFAIAGGGTGSYSYLWTSSPPGTTSTSPNISVSPEVSTDFYVQVNDGNQTVEKTISVNVFSLPTAYSINSGGYYCMGGEGIEIILDGSDIGIEYTLLYQLSPVEVMVGDGLPISFGFKTEPGAYNIIARNNNTGCISDQNGVAVIGINENPIADAGPNHLINAGDFTTLSGSAAGGSGGYNFSWDPSDSLINSGSSDPSTIPLSSTTLFNLIVTDNSGCQSNEDNCIVFVSGGDINLNIMHSGSPVCPGSEVQLYAMVSGGNGSFSYFWQSTPPGFTSTSFEPVVYPDVTTTYIVTVSDGLTTVSDSVVIIVNPNPISFAINGGGEVCLGEDPDNITLQSSESNIDYQLFRDGSYTGMNITGDGFALDFGTWSMDGDYTIFAINNTSFCEGDMSGIAEVIINDLPLANAGNDQQISAGSSSILEGSANGGAGNYLYYWQPSYLCLSPGSQNTNTQPIGQSTLFTLTVTDENTQCLSEPDTMFVYTEGENLYVNLSALPGILCSGEELSLTAIAGGGTGSYSFSWSSIPVGYFSSNAVTVDYPAVSTTYYIDVFDGLTHVTDSIFIEVKPLPILYNVLGGGSYCEGDEGPLVSLSDSESTSTYKLFRSPSEHVSTLNGTGQLMDFGNYTQSGSYFVTALSQDNCWANMIGDVLINIDPIPLAQAGDEQYITYNTQVLLQGEGLYGSGSYSFSWLPKDSLVDPEIQNPLTIPLHNTTMFDLEVMDNTSGCISDETNTVIFVSGGPFNIQLTSSIPTICYGEETQLFALGTGGSGTYSYLWTSDPPGFTSSLYNPTVSPDVSTTYYVAVNDGSAILNEQISITVLPLPLSYSLSGGGEYCEGQQPDEIILQNSQINTSYSLLLNGSPIGLEIDGTGFPLNFSSQMLSGQYSVFAIENASQCSNYMAGEVMVDNFQLPIAVAGPDLLIPKNTIATLSGLANNGSGSYSYTWEPTVLCQNPNYQTTITNLISTSTMFKLRVSDIQTQCISIPDTMFIFTSGDDLSVSASSSLATICSGQPVDLLAIPVGGSGSYTFTWTSNPGCFNSSQMSAIAQPNQSTMYYVEVFDGVDYAIDSTYVQVAQSSNNYTLSGGGYYCDGENGVEIFLDGSDLGLVYRLFRSPDISVIDVVGTGSTISLGVISITGNYFVIANPDVECSKQMNGVITVGINQLPISNAGDDRVITWMNQAVLVGSGIGGSGDYSFKWSPIDSLINPCDKEPLTIPLHSTTLFSLEVSDIETGCVGDEDQAVVYVSGGPLIVDTYSTNSTICENENTQLFALASGGSGDYDFLWLSNPPGFSSDVYNPVVQPNVSTIYTVIINDGTSTITDSVVVNVTPGPLAFNTFGGGSYCENENGVEIQLDGSEQYVAYELFNEYGSTGVIVPGTGDTISFGIQSNEAYYWTTGLNETTGCSGNMNDTIQVLSDYNPVSDAGSDQYILHGASTQLFGNATEGSGYYNFNWFPDYLLENPCSQNPITNNIYESTLFSMVVDDANSGCISEADSIIVYIMNTELLVSVSASPLQICQRNNVSLSALPGGGSGNYTYNWYSNPTGFYSNIQFPVDNPQLTLTYIVEVSDGDTTVIDSVVVEVIESPIYYEIIGGGSYCKNGEGVNISLDGSQKNIEYTLYLNQTINLLTILGDGLPIDFGNYNTDGSYIIIAGNSETGCGSQMTGSVVVSQYPQPFADAGADVSISGGLHTTLSGSASGGTGNYEYMWSPPEKLLNPNDPDATTVVLNATTMFSLTVNDGATGCYSDPSNMVVFISGGPLTADIMYPSNQVCPGESVSLYALPGGGNGNYSYFWESVPVGYYATSAQISINPGVSTWYKLEVTDGDMVIRDSVYIEMLPVPESFDLTGGGGYCIGTGGVEIFLENSSQSTVYSLFHNTLPTGNYVNGTGNKISFGNLMSDGNYSVKAENTNGCSSLMNNVIQVYIDPLPERYQLVGGGTYCENDPTLGLLLESSQVNVDYELYKDADPTGQIVSGSGLPLGFTAFSGTGNYSVVASGTNSGCINTMHGTVGLIINDKPDIIIVGDTSMCSGDSIVLSGSGGYSYEWNTSPPEYTPGIIVSPHETSNYLLIGYSLNTCSDTNSHVVNVGTKPEISVVNDQVQLIIYCYPDNLDSYNFNVGNVEVQNGTENSWYYGDFGIISDTVFIAAMNEDGCMDIESVFVELKDAPNAFTPNGDGVNDLFLEGYDITVYSSWGGEIYMGKTGWDGTYNGSMVTPGTYYYVHVVYNSQNEIIKTLKGSVTVVIE
jgi:gliding motility-associated-like protein